LRDAANLAEKTSGRKAVVGFFAQTAPDGRLRHVAALESR
jgi:hypothetical protein